MLETNKEKDAAKKGVAVKKRGEKKAKPKWIGWTELSSDGEQEFKKNVDAQWDVEEGLAGRRRRDSKAVAEETELSPRALRARSRSELQINKRAHDENEDKGEDREVESEGSIYQEMEDTSALTSSEFGESNESSYQKNEDTSIHTSGGSEEESEASVYQWRKEEAHVDGKLLVISGSSDESNDSENTMDVDQETMPVENDSPDQLSDPSSGSEDEKSSHPGHAKSACKGSHEDPASQLRRELNDTIMDMEYEYEDAVKHQDEQPIANRIDPPSRPDSINTNAHPFLYPSASIPTPTKAPHDIDTPESYQSPPPSSEVPAPSTTSNQTATSAVSPTNIFEATPPATTGHEEKDAIKKSQPTSITAATAMFDHENLYHHHQSTNRGVIGFPESRMRSTLPRLG